MNNIKQIRDIVRLLNTEFTPADIIVSEYGYGKVFQKTVVKRKPHFTAFYDKFWKIYCDSYSLWCEENFIIFKKEIVKHFAKQGMKIKFEYLHPITVEIKLANKNLISIKPERFTAKLVTQL